MVARVHNVFSLAEILKIFLSETTKPIELWLYTVAILDIILKVYHLRAIHAMFALNWLTGFRGEDF
jgi:hypothetical protein